jgi:glycosyltransferase involved in cell wall biosynthesis
MRIVFFTSVISPHALPLARALAAHCEQGGFHYLYTEELSAERQQLGWNIEDLPDWVMPCRTTPERVRGCDLLARANVVIYNGFNLFGLWQLVRGNARILLATERWFKPPIGMWRLLFPRYLWRACRIVRMVRRGRLTYLAIGEHAARDFARVCGLLSGDARCLFRAPNVQPAERAPMAPFRLMVSGGQSPAARQPWYARRILLWGYFPTGDDPDVAATASDRADTAASGPLRILWCGRMLGWKRVDTIINAVQLLRDGGIDARLRIVGDGHQKEKWENQAATLIAAGIVRFEAAVPINRVREYMRQADVYVIASSGYEGWGAVVNEAMFEGCVVVGTAEAGAMTMVMEGCNGFKFHCGDTHALAGILRQLATQRDLLRQVRQMGMAEVRELWGHDAAARSFLSRAWPDYASTHAEAINRRGPRVHAFIRSQALYWLRFLSRWQSLEPSLRCLYCHNVFDDQIRSFDNLLGALQDMGTFVDTRTCLEMVRGERAIDRLYFHLSFDDGTQNIARNAVPLLAKRGIRGLFFVSTSLLGGGKNYAPVYSMRTTNCRRPIKMCAWDELKDVRDAGTDIGSHLHTHTRVSARICDQDVVRHELAISKELIETRRGTPCETLAWPYGTTRGWGQMASDLAQSVGYRACFTGRRGSVGQTGCDPMGIPRHHFEADWPPAHVRYFASGHHELSRRDRQRQS